VNSIGKTPKRREVFNFLRKKDADIYILVDTRIDKKITNLVKAEWRGLASFSCFTPQSRGVAMLFKKGLPVEILDKTSDTNGNLLNMLITYSGKHILLSGIY